MSRPPRMFLVRWAAKLVLPLAAGLVATGMFLLAPAVAQTETETPAAGLARASDLVAAEKFDAAMAALLALAERYPGAAAIPARIGMIDFELRAYRAAIKRFEQAIALAPGEADYQFQLGRALTGRISGAGLFKKPGIAKRMRRAFEDALRLDPGHARARLALASYLANAPGFMGGSRKKARATAGPLKDIDLATFHRALARIALADDQDSDGLAHYRVSLQISFEGRTAVELAAVLQSEKKWPEAFAILERLLAPSAAEPPPLIAHFLYGRAAVDSGSHHVAGGQALDRFIAADPRRKSKEARAEAHYLRGRIFEQAGQPAAARRGYKAAVRLDRDYKPASRALRRLGRADSGG